MIFFDHLLTNSDLYIPAPFSGKGKFRGTFQQLFKKYYLSRPFFLFIGDLSFIKSCRKHECICLEIDRVCFYYPPRLDIIGYHSKNLWIMKIRVSLHLLTQFHRICRPILMLWFRLRGILFHV